MLYLAFASTSKTRDGTDSVFASNISATCAAFRSSKGGGGLGWFGTLFQIDIGTSNTGILSEKKTWRRRQKYFSKIQNVSLHESSPRNDLPGQHLRIDWPTYDINSFRLVSRMPLVAHEGPDLTAQDHYLSVLRYYGKFACTRRMTSFRRTCSVI